MKRRIIAAAAIGVLAAAISGQLASAAPSLTRSAIANATWVTYKPDGALVHTVFALQDEEVGGPSRGWAEFSVMFCPYADAEERTWDRCRLRQSATTTRMKLEVDDLAGTARLVAVTDEQRQVVRWKRHNPFPWPGMGEEYCPYPVPGGAGAGLGSLFARGEGKILGTKVIYDRTEAGSFGQGYRLSICS
jgi:hypothetical protein